MLGVPDIKSEVLPRQSHRASQPPCSCTAIIMCGLTWGGVAGRAATLPSLHKRSHAGGTGAQGGPVPRQRGRMKGHHRQGLGSPRCRTAGRTALAEWGHTDGGRGPAACAGVGERPHCCCGPRLRTGSGWAWTHGHGGAGRHCLQGSKVSLTGVSGGRQTLACRAHAQKDASLSGTGGKAQGCRELLPREFSRTALVVPHGSLAMTQVVPCSLV